MRNILVILLAVALGVSLMSCSKKEKTLEEMQQPMSPEDLNRIKTETQGAQPASQATVVSTTEHPVAEQLPPSGPFAPTPTDIQTALKNAGFYTGSIDGKIGPKSTAAIEAFQKANGLTADGKVGPKTWAALSKFLTAAAPAKPASGD